MQILRKYSFVTEDLSNRLAKNLIKCFNKFAHKDYLRNTAFIYLDQRCQTQIHSG